MRKMTKKALCFLLAIGMIVSMAGCTTYDNFKESFFSSQEDDSDVIYVGVYEPMSGQYKSMGQEEIKGIELAHEMMPNVIGKRVELVYADNKSNIYEAETALDDLFKHDISFLLGSYGETLTLFAGDYLKENDVPGITISSTNPLITNNNPYFFTATYAESRQGIALADYAYKSANKKNYAVIKLEGDDLGAEIIRRFTSRLKTDSGDSKNIKKTYVINNNTTDFSEIINGLIEREIDCVLLPVDPISAKNFFYQADKMGYTDALFLGIDSWNDDNLQKAITRYSEFDIAYPAEKAATKDNTEEYEKFHKAYHEKYGEGTDPSLAIMTAYDSYMLAMKAIENAYNNVMTWDIDDVTKDMNDSLARATRKAYELMIENDMPDGVRIRNALTEITDYAGASGEITYNGNNECIKSITIIHNVWGREVGTYVY